jgi:hypothetical protein
MSAKKSSGESPAKPQVIDLGPEDVIVQPDTPDTEQLAEAEVPPHAGSNKTPSEEPSQTFPTPQRKSRYPFALPLAALTVGLVGGGWIYRDYLSSYFPSNTVTELSSRLAAMEQSAKVSADISTSLGQQISGLQTDVKKIDQTTATTAQGSEKLNVAMQKTSARLQSAEAAIASAQKDGKDLKATITNLSLVPGTSATIDNTALADLRQRIDALEQELAAIKTAKPEISPAAKLTQAMSNLRQKINAGAPFAAELAGLRALEPDLQSIADLEAQSSIGLPNAAMLADELLTIADKLPSVTTNTQPDESYGSWIADQLSGLITITTVGEPDWKDLAIQSASTAATGNLAQAVTELDAAGGTMPPELQAWRDRANARIALDDTLAKLFGAVMQRIAEKG